LNDGGPDFSSWDLEKDHHRASLRAIKPLDDKWRSKPSKPSKVSVAQAVQHLEEQGRFFGHELPSDYIPHIISQGGIQSGFNTSLALGLPKPRRDPGTAASGFVFTRQLPPNKPKMTHQLNQGQVGAGVDAMLVLHPSMFGDPEQPAYFKATDGAHHSASIMPSHDLKGDHIKRASDEMARSTDTIFHANQEQALRGQVPLHHLAAIVLKTKPGEVGSDKKQAFIEKLRTTARGDALPPKADRAFIKGAPRSGVPPKTPRSQAEMSRRFAAFQHRVVGQSLEDHLEGLLNVNTVPGARRRQVSDVVIPLDDTTRRADVPSHLPPRHSPVPIHQRKIDDYTRRIETYPPGDPTRNRLEVKRDRFVKSWTPNPAFFKPRP
jgi:hypothetical protein